jgi:geranylgeranyl reductase family protein
MVHYDVIIIGGGPIGGTVGKLIANEGYRVLILEEHNTIGLPVQCAGLVTPRVFELLKSMTFSKNVREAILNNIYGAEIYVPSGNCITFRSKELKAIVIDRTKFDSSIVEHAINVGAELSTATIAISAVRKKPATGVDVTFKYRNKPSVGKKYVTGKILVGADGARSKVRTWFKFGVPKQILTGFGAEFEATNLSAETVKILVGTKLAPSFFSWLIPVPYSDNLRVRIGLCVGGHHKPVYWYFKNLLMHSPFRKYLRTIQPAHRITGVLPLGLLSKIYTDNVVIVGDAACQVKPTSGGGIYTGLLSAQYCAERIIKALEEGNYTARRLKAYQHRWLATIGKELRIGWKLYNIYKKLNDNQLNYLATILNRPELTKIISDVGDLDYPSAVALTLIKKEPQLIKFIGPVLKSLLLRHGALN